jgi:hypothetical protein
MTKQSLYAVVPSGLYVGTVCTLLPIFVAVPVAGTQPAGAPCAPCVVASVTPGQTLALPPQLNGLEILVRVAAGDLKEAVSALEAVRTNEGVAGLHLLGLPGGRVDPAALELTSRVIVDVSSDRDTEADSLAFQLKRTITDLRAAAVSPVSVGVAVTAAQASALLARGLAPYVDLIVWMDDGSASATVEAWGTIPEAGRDAAALVRAAGARSTSYPRQLWRAPEDAVRTSRLLADLSAAAPLLPPGLVPGAGIQLSCAGRVVDTYLNPETLDTIALAEHCGVSSVLGGAPAGQTAERVVLSSGEAILRLAAAQDRVAEGVQVTAARQLSVAEIIARHQAAAARQASAVRELISTGTMTLTFEAPGFPAPVAITSQVVIYAGRDRTEIEQRAVRVNGIEFRGGGIPRLPIIEPERVASPPLAITLSNVYRYELAGRETTAGTPCYVVAFTPVDTDRPLFRGRAWIAVDSFAMVRVAAAQTGLRGPIVSSEQADEFRRDEAGRWLLARSDVRQIYEGAAHRTPIHRVLDVQQQEVNPPEFAARRTAAYSSSSVMLRDTPEGYRYLRRQPGPATASGADASAIREPEVVGGASRVRTLIAGVIIDPNITKPLPFAGLSYMDFNLLGTGAQLNAFFGGTYGQMAFSAPSLGGTRWQLAGRAFGIASSYNDRAFIEGREQYTQNIRQRPAHASVWLLRPISPRVSVRAGYDLDYTHFAASEITAPAFVVPPHQVNHGARLALEGQRGGWHGSLWWNPARRAGWRAWGPPGSAAYDPRHRDFQRYGITVARSAVLTPQLVARVEGAWMSGRDLDRFSRYAFGTFDNRLRGYPSALVRYDRGGVVRGAVAWAPGGLVRLDGFADTAYVRDPGFGSSPRRYTGFGAAIEAPAPFGTLVAVEWGYGLQGINADGGRGTQVIRVSGFKIF